MTNSLSEQVAELEADHDRLGRKLFRLEAERNDLQRQVQEVRDEVTFLRSTVQKRETEIDGLQQLLHEANDKIDTPCCDDRLTDSEREQIDTYYRLIRHPFFDSARRREGGSFADAMVEKLDVVAPQPTGYADDDHQDAEVTQWHESSSQLTAHALNDAPVGSWLARLFHNSRKKGDDGRWHKAWMFEGQRAETSEDLIAEGWADATLTTPEDA